MPNLVGIGNSQVPTNAMLGGLAYQDSVDEVTLKKIKAKTSDTATDIFVYDTRKDSDGGAWRHRTTDKSWYNETASSTRGARKEFPVVAVIVIEAYEIIIYDGDDPNLSMWMRFTIPAYTVGSNYAYTPVGVVYVNAYPHNSINLSCVHMLNGQLFVGANREGNASQSFSAGFEINFINEEMYEYLHYPQTASRNSKWRLGGNISQRNSNQQTNTPTSRYGDGIGVSQNKYLGWANGVDMKVFPDDPIDPSTGLPKPTIVVASTLGISIMRGTGAMPEMTTTAANAQPVKKIQITKSNKLAFKHHTDWVYFYDIPVTNKSGSYWNSLDGYLGRFTGTNRNYEANGIPLNTEGPLPNFAEDRAIGHPNGLSLIDINTISYAGQSTGYKMHCDIGTDFNSGWQMGDVKRALLSSTDDTDLNGTELVTNGNFSGNTVTGWTEREAGGSFTASNAEATLTYSSGVASWRQDIAITAGKTYHLSFTVVSTTTSSIQFYYNHGSPGGDLAVSMSGSAGKFSATFIAVSNSVRIFPRIFASGNMVLDNISLREGDMDRSDHPQYSGLGAIGTVPKTPVADGAELMAYGPFSSSIGLVQTYRSDLDYGTGDFYYMIWIKLSGHSPLQGIWSRQGSNQTSGNRIQVQTVGSANGEVAIYSPGKSGNFNADSALGIGVWHHLAMVRRSGTMYWYKDGVQFDTYSDTTNYDNTDAPLRLGGLSYQNHDIYNTNQYPMTQGKLALFRTGKQAPTPEQMEKIYDDEKHLFAENAKCTLHGTSNSVVGLALDDTDDTIHAGTSSGRSQFQGLTRINNTTTAVTTVISASDGLVAEQ